MIERLVITKPEDVCVEWWPDVPWLEGKTSIEFSPGVNYIVGPNGSGKSTVLVALARMLHCAQGGTQKVTGTSMSAVLHRGETVWYACLTGQPDNTSETAQKTGPCAR